MKYKKVVVLTIILISIVLRFYKLGQIPAGFNWDEASIGYNAYSILKTGKDEFNRFLPVSFKSYNDYKMPLYIYFTVPSVFLFGLSEFAVRFSSAFFGSLSIIVFYLLTGEILRSLKRKNKSAIQVIAMLFLAVSPWHLQFSRMALEQNLAFFLTILGVLLFIKSIKKPFLLLFSGISFILSIYSYHSALVFSPLVSMLLLILFYKKVIKNKKYLIVTAVFCFLMLVPLLRFILTPEGLTRFKGTSSLNEVNINILSIEKIKQDSSFTFLPDFLSKIIHNRRIYYAKQILNGYLSHYSLNFLFLPADTDKHHAPQVGYLYLVWLPFLFYGIYKIFDLKLDKKIVVFIFAYLLFAAIPAAPTVETPQAVRSFNILVPLIWLISIGVGVLYNQSKDNKKTNKYLAFLALAFAVNVFFYLHMYFAHLPKEHSKHWQYGYKELMGYFKDNSDKYQNIVFYSKGATLLDKAHGFVLFYTQYDPKKYQNEGGTKLCHFGFAGRYNFDKYYFRTIKCFEEEPLIEISKDYLNFGSNTAFVVYPKDVPNDVKIIKQIYNFYNEPVLSVFIRKKSIKSTVGFSLLALIVFIISNRIFSAQFYVYLFFSYLILFMLLWKNKKSIFLLSQTILAGLNFFIWPTFQQFWKTAVVGFFVLNLGLIISLI
ncbi:hypothetical protein ACFLZ1_04640, partial [Patescibacteria group bacterium]